MKGKNKFFDIQTEVPLRKGWQIDLDNYEVIRQIGKGSFSNVFLCKNEMPLFISESEHHEELFIIKEININELVKKYMLNTNNKTSTNKASTSKRVTSKTANMEVNITPYKENGISDIKTKEHEYYYNRLRQLIESEIEVLSCLDHSNIIKFYGYTYNNGIYYLRMEYCNGGDVYEYLKGSGSGQDSGQGISNDFLYEFIKQTSDGLLYLHNKDIIHRDIKLHNVLIKMDNNKILFKISDFGFSCYDLTSKLDIDVDEILVKKYYKLCGTPYYMAPEIILNMNKLENITMYNKSITEGEYFYDKRIDIWSYGICIYELLFNILPFSNIKNVDDLEKFYRLPVIQEIMDKRVSKKGSLNDDFKILLLNMLKVDYKSRYNIIDVNNYINYKLDKIILNRNNELNDVINCKENNYKKNEQMKQHIVRNPVFGGSNIEKVNDKSESWEKINKSSSLIMKISVQNGFLNWLLKK
jgi:serine/threonine protein kinase